MRDDAPIGCLLGLFVVCIMSWMIISAIWNQAYIRQAVKHGEASYGSKTGNLIWKNDTEPPTAAPRQE